MILLDANKFCPQKGVSINYVFKKQLFHKQTKYQTIDIYESEAFGNVLVIDNDLNLAASDNKIYDKALTDPLLPAKNILIMGGGDCGVLREILSHKEVERVEMVDIDKAVIDAAKQFMPSVVGSSLKDKRSKIIIGNAFDAIKVKERYDGIVYDLTMDPVGAPKDFFAAIANALKSSGKLTMQISCIHNKKMIERAEKSLEKNFKNIKFFEINIPSFLEPWIFVRAEKK